MLFWIRLRAFLGPFLLYGASAIVSTYFIWHAVHGERGLRTNEEYYVKMKALAAEQEALQKQRREWERRVGMMKAEALDQDLLEETAQAKLGWVHPHDVFIFLPSPRSPSPSEPELKQ